jgi:hypothetical protein
VTRLLKRVPDEDIDKAMLITIVKMLTVTMFP